MEIWTIKRPLTGLVRPCTMTVEGHPYRWIKDIARMLSSEKDCALKMLNCPCLCSPPYLPCVFPKIFVTFIYIHPREKADEASVLTRQVTQRLIYISWHSIWVLADFNYCSLKKTWSDLHQYVTCLIRLKNALGLCYGSVKGAHKALPLPLREGADPNIQLIPFISNYPKEGKKTLIKQTKKWSDDSMLSLGVLWLYTTVISFRSPVLSLMILLMFPAVRTM